MYTIFTLRDRSWKKSIYRTMKLSMRWGNLILAYMWLIWIPGRWIRCRCRKTLRIRHIRKFRNGKEWWWKLWTAISIRSPEKKCWMLFRWRLWGKHGKKERKSRKCFAKGWWTGNTAMCPWRLITIKKGKKGAMPYWLCRMWMNVQGRKCCS